MHERHKLTEARYFIDRMRAEHGDPTHFRFEVSAFLGAARSVLQYACQEAKGKAGGQHWYQQAIAADQLLEFMRDQRDKNVHTTPVTPASSMKMRESAYLIIEGTMIPHRHNTGDYQHHFADWHGDETVMELSERYVTALHAFVADGIARQLISG
jgi:hypothetical protein